MDKTRQLQEMVREYQTGIPDKKDMPQIGRVNGREPSTINADEQAIQARLQAGDILRRLEEEAPYAKEQLIEGTGDINLTEQLAKSGFGTKAIDDKVDPFHFLEDQEDARASVQKGMSQLVNGGLKMATTTMGQLVDTTIGMVMGATNMVANLENDIYHGNKLSFMGNVIDPFVNNFVSQTVERASKLSEELFPNYKTAKFRQNEEENWLRNLFTANFWGDAFIKNLGFTLGSQLGVQAAFGAFNIPNILSRNLSSNLAKATVAASNGSGKALESLERMVKQGNMSKSAFDEITKAASELHKMNTKLQITGSLIGALSESRTEGINAATEFADAARNEAVAKYNDDMAAIDTELYKKYGGEGFDIIRDESGNVVDYKIVDPQIQAERDAEAQKVSDKYFKKLDLIMSSAENLAGMTFILNMGILTPSNMVMFGKMYTGGWKNANISKRAKVRGKMNIADDAISGGYKGTLFDGKLGKVVDAGRAIAKPLMTEGSEELFQKIASEGEKRIAEQSIAMFNNDAYDETTLENIGRRFTTMFDSMKTVVADQSSWEEFFIGGLTGILGMPGNIFKGKWNGGAITEYKAFQDKRDVTNKLATKLNSLVDSKEFQDYWKAYVRNNKYEDEQKAALDAKDQYTWQTASSKQLINNVMLFAQAGKLNDLNDMVDHYLNLSESDAEDVRAMIQSTADSFDRVNNLTDSEVLDPIKKRAAQVKKTIQDYKEMYETIIVQNPTASEDRIQEMMFTSLQLKNFEDRYNRMVDELRNGSEKGKNVGIDNVINGLTSVDVKHKDGTTTNETGERLEKTKERLRNALDYIVGLQNVDDNFFSDLFSKIQMDKAVDFIKESIKLSNEDIAKLDDIVKVSKSRNEYYKKLVNLSKMSDKSFAEEAENREKQKEKAEAKMNIEVAGKFNSVHDVRNYVQAAEKKESAVNVRARLAKFKNKYVDQFMKIDSFYKSVSDKIEKMKIGGDEKKIREAIDTILKMRIESSNSIDEFVDNIFPSYEDTKSPTEAKTADEKTVYNNAVGYIKKAFEDVKKVNAKTGVGTVSRPVAQPQPQPQSQPQPRPKPQLSQSSDPSSIGGAIISKGTGYPVLRTTKDMIDYRNKLIEEGKTPEEAEMMLTIALSQGSMMQLSSLRPNADDEYNDEQRQLDEQEKDRARVEAELDKLTPEEGSGDAAVRYYEPAIPEVDSGEARMARSKSRSRYDADLRDFDVLHPEYSAIYQALKDRGAFSYVDNGNVKVDDNVYFGIDPTFPTYQDAETGEVQKQILIYVKDSKGNMQVVGVLPSNMRSDRYFGIEALRADIEESYNKFMESKDNVNKTFFFGQRQNGTFDTNKMSKVWAVRKGLFDYAYSMKDGKRDLASDNRAIVDIDGFDPNATIILNSGKETIRERFSRNEVISGKNVDIKIPHKQAGLYYVAKDSLGNDALIRLNVSHFNEEEMPSGSSLHTEITKILDDFLHTDMSDDKCMEAKKKLNDILYLNDLVIEKTTLDSDGSDIIRLAVIKRDENGIVYKDVEKKIPEWETIGRFDYDRISKADDKTKIVDSMIEKLYSINRPINVSPRTTKEQWNKFVNGGYIKSNVESFTQKGGNFYFNSYDPNTHSFERIEREEDAAPEEQAPAAPAVQYDELTPAERRELRTRQYNNELTADVELTDYERLVKRSNGSEEFGRYGALKIVLPAGYVSYDASTGYRDMKANSTNIQNYGFRNIEEFVLDVLDKYTRVEKVSNGDIEMYRLIYEGKGGNVLYLDLAKRSNRPDALEIWHGDIEAPFLYQPGEVIETRTVTKTEEKAKEQASEEQPKQAEEPKAAYRVRGARRQFLKAGPQVNNKIKIDFERELSWLDSVLPQLLREDKVEIINGLIEVNSKGDRAYGEFTAGVMILSDEAVEGTTYHEAFHYVFNTMLSDEERNQLIDEASKIWGTTETLALEELLAEEFRYWKLNGRFTEKSGLNEKPNLVKRIISFFKRLLNMVDNRYAYLSGIFGRIDTGKYSYAHDCITQRNQPDLAYKYEGTFKQEHIDKAIEFLKSEAKKGYVYNIVGNTRNIKYSEKDGFTFLNPNKVGKTGTNLTVSNFFKFIMRTKNNYDYLDPEVKKCLEKKGITKEEFDESPKILKEHIVACASVF